MINIKKLVVATLATVTLLNTSAFADKVSTYLEGALQEASAVQTALKGAGFTVLAEHQIDKKGNLTTVVFTCPTLKKMADKEEKGFASVLRVLVNKADNEISITNPIYFSKAFLQKSYDEAGAKKVLDKINQAFPGLKGSSDGMDFDDLDGYHFMMGMPYFDDMAKVGKGSHDELLAKVKAYKGGKNLVFELNLSKDRTIVGFKIGKKTSKFIKKIGTKNAALLPYVVLIEDGKARILAPKYYLALSYPSLSMSQFMTIATVPGAIEKDCSKAFK
ncbi:MAG TPA: hypothetical protein EYG95_05395 [Campylobacterales bacterium]|nr:hypothetical protein [Campylobacterales bacterium]